VSREASYEQAAVCYRRASYDLEAARCYRLAGAHRRAAEIYEAEGRYADAATSFADAGLPELGAWLLAHHAGLPDQARVLLGTPGAEATQQAQPQRDALRRSLILARCEIAEGAASDVIRPVITDVCAVLASRGERSDQVTEKWAVALSDAAARFDQAALVFAAAVRGGRYGAEHRWKAWSARVLGVEVILPLPVSAPSATTAS
jgi:hypothetical protein